MSIAPWTTFTLTGNVIHKYIILNTKKKWSEEKTGNTIGEEETRMMSESLKGNSTLTSLNLSSE